MQKDYPEKLRRIRYFDTKNAVKTQIWIAIKNILDKIKKNIYWNGQGEVKPMGNQGNLRKNLIVLSGVAVVAVLKGTAALFL